MIQMNNTYGIGNCLFGSVGTSGSNAGVNNRLYKNDIFRNQKNDNTSKVDYAKLLREKTDEMEEKLKNGENNPTFSIGAKTYTIKEWDTFIEKYDKAQDEVVEEMREEIKERIEERIEEMEKQKLVEK